MVQYSLSDIVGDYCCHGGCGGRGCGDGFGLVSVYFGTVSDVGAFIGVDLCWWEGGGCCWRGSVFLLCLICWRWENGGLSGR